MNADLDRPCWEETEQILSCAFEVLNSLGHGFREKSYENALVVEFARRDIPYEQQPHYPLDYKGTQIDEFIPDLIAFDKVVIDTKTVEAIGQHEIGQMINYLKITTLPVGLLLNFKRPRLEHRRVILSSNS